VHVRQTLQSTNKKGIIFEPPKTKNSKRRITIPLQTTEALKEYEKLWDESRKNYPGEDDLVFVTNKHSPLSPQNFLRRFWNRLQMDVEFAMNDFIPKPMPITDVSRALGHARVSTYP